MTDGLLVPFGMIVLDTGNHYTSGVAIHALGDLEFLRSSLSTKYFRHPIIDDFDVARIKMGASWHLMDYILGEANCSKTTRRFVQKRKTLFRFLPQAVGDSA